MPAAHRTVIAAAGVGAYPQNFSEPMVEGAA
jgi:hypothetical protein